MSILLIALGVAAIVYGASVMLIWSGSGFFAVWYAIGAALAGCGVAMRLGAWQAFPRALRMFVGVAAALAAAVTLGVAALILTTAHEPAPEGLDELVVLGAQVRPDGSPSTVLHYRLDTAADYLRENPSTRCVVSGGKGANEPCSEAEAMARYLESCGIVTNDFHVLRATRIAAKQGYANARGIAAPSDAWYVPNNVLREVMGIVKDFLFGNM